jgi:hypothetical protein
VKNPKKAITGRNEPGVADLAIPTSFSFASNLDDRHYRQMSSMEAAQEPYHRPE